MCSNGVPEAFIKSINGEYSYQVGETGKKIVTIQTKTKNEITLSANSTYFPRTQIYNVVDSGYIKYRLIVLEGDYTNKPIPDYFTGMKSSFEDKLVPENLYKFSSRDDFYLLDNNATLDGEYIKMTANSRYQNAMLKPLATIKPSTTYTIVADVVENTLNSMLFITNNSNDVQLPSTQKALQINAGKTGIFTYKITTRDDLSNCARCLVNYLDSFNTTGSVKYRIMVVEGDYTNYDFTDYDSSKGGKYKVDYKVTGKNKWNGTWTKVANSKQHESSFIKVNSNSKYILSISNNYNVGGAERRFNVQFYDKDKKYINFIITGYLPDNAKINIPYNCKYIKIINRVNQDFTEEYTNIEDCTTQLEEGDTATTYEPYKESIKTLYLNSPLLEGDTIEQSGNDIIHNHKYGKVVLDGSNYSIVNYSTYDSTKYRWVLYKNDNILKNTNNANILINDRYSLSTPSGTWGSDNNYIEGITINSQDSSILLYLDKYNDGSADSKASLIAELQQNPITVVYKLATPTQEVISTNDNLLLNSYTNGHLDVDTVVPIDKVMFKNKGFENKYLNPNTDYIIQFESDNVGKIDYIILGGNHKLNIEVTKGTNKILCTSGELGNWLDVVGIGFNASKIVVTPKVEQTFGYFKGMKSVGECEGNVVEVVAQNKNLFTSEVIDALCTLENWVGNGAYRNNYVAYKLMNFKTGITYTNTIPDIKVPPKFYPILFLDNINNGNFIPSGWYENNTDNEKTVSGNKFTFTGKNEGHFRAYVSNWNEENMQKLRKVLEQNIQVEIGNNSTGFVAPKSNKQTITHEPLRGLPNGVKDKYVIIDGKWYIERNCAQVIFDGSDDENWKISTNNNDDYTTLFFINNGVSKINNSAISDKFKTIASYLSGQPEGIKGDNLDINIRISNIKANTLSLFKTWLANNPTTVIYQLAQPTYESIDYNPFEVYTDITHISNNSIIPCNMVIRNSGFNCILKPNTTYTVSSNNGLSSVVTKASIGDSVLRFYDKDTTSVTKMSKVLVLEGDYITGNPPIPAFFKGMESAFEQELVTDEKDKNYGKYKVNVKATNADNSQENNITFYLKEPLRGVGDIKDKVYVKEDKVVVERNCASVILDGTEDWFPTKDFAVENDGGHISFDTNKLFGIATVNKGYICDKFSYMSYDGGFRQTGNFEGISDGGGYNLTFIRIKKAKLETNDIEGVKKYLSSNPIEVLYVPQSQPIYEEVEYFDMKLFVEIFKDTTIIYSSNIPVTSTINYTYSTPLTDAVNTVSDISDQQDSMIIDMAAQVATMEMMLM